MTAVAPEAILKLRRDVRDAAATLSDREARYLVDAYYTIQEHRIEAQNQVRALTASDEPNAVLGWLFDQHHTIEREIAKALGDYGDHHTAGQWAKTVTGIGPIIAAGLLAHIDVNKAPTVGHIWRFAGLDPTVKWERGKKRPWNADLKVLCWKAGESFVKVSGRAYEKPEAVSDESTAFPERAVPHESTESTKRILLDQPASPLDLYAWVFVKRKIQEVERNEAGLFADQAAATLEEKNIGKTTDAYKAYAAGRLPAARIHARAKRYTVKLFLAHYHHVLYESTFGELPPKPYVIEHLGHVHYIGPPGWPMG